MDFQKMISIINKHHPTMLVTHSSCYVKLWLCVVNVNLNELITGPSHVLFGGNALHLSSGTPLVSKRPGFSKA